MRSISYFFKKYTNTIIFFILIILSVILLVSSGNAVIQQIKAGGFTFFSFFQAGFSGVSAFFSDVSVYFANLKTMSDELERTKTELAAANEKVAELEDLRKQNIQLRGIIGYSYTIPSIFDEKVRIIPASIIAKQPGNYSMTIVINKGSKDGIKTNMAVISPYNGHQGLVGKIITAGTDTSVILPLFNNSFYISAEFRDSAYEGLVNGQGESSRYVSMQFVEKNAKSEIKYGDLVISSGIGELFPRGIHIGKVRVITSKSFETSMECSVEPVIDFGRLENVFIVARGR